MFDASTILAKHDERYMPREVVDALKKKRALAGRWRQRGSRSAAKSGDRAGALRGCGVRVSRHIRSCELTVISGRGHPANRA